MNLRVLTSFQDSYLRSYKPLLRAASLLSLTAIGLAAGSYFGVIGSSSSHRDFTDSVTDRLPFSDRSTTELVNSGKVKARVRPAAHRQKSEGNFAQNFLYKIGLRSESPLSESEQMLAFLTKNLEDKSAEIRTDISLSADNSPVFTAIKSTLFSPQENKSPVIVYKIKAGDSIRGILKGNGASDSESEAIANQISRFNEFKLKAGTNIRIERESISESNNPSTASQIKAVSLKPSAGMKITVLRKGGGNFEGKLAKLKTVETERIARGSISSSLVASARKENVPYAVIDAMADLLSERIEFRKDIHPGDKFGVVYSEMIDEDGEVISLGKVKVAAIISGNKTVASFRYVAKDGSVHHLDERGNLVGNYFLKYPVAFTRISSVFSDARLHPVLKIKRPHNGVDFAAPIGTPVRVVADGVVVKSGRSATAGNFIEIKHDNRYSTTYLHLNKIESRVKPGTKVARGQVIGTVGMTGLTSGPHLHFGLFDKGTYVDPLRTKLPVITANNLNLPKDFVPKMLALINSNNNNLYASAITTNKERS